MGAAAAGRGPARLAGVGADELARAVEVVLRDQDLARTRVADCIAGACTDVRLAVIAGDPFVRKKPQIVSASSEFRTTMSRTSFISLPFLAAC